MKYVIVKTTVGDREAYQRCLKSHLGFLDELRRRGILFISGTFEGMAEAIDIARKDPLVKAGVDSYQVKTWITSSPDMSADRGGSVPIQPVESGPFEVSAPEEDGFTVVEVGEEEGKSNMLVRCLAPDQIPLDDACRVSFLGQARDCGLQKLLLIYEDQVAGQLEYAPARGSGLPIVGSEVAVIHCIWVLDAFTGLAGGRRLLAACAERTSAQSLVTIAYNDNLPWMPSSFFRSQGFSTLEQVETGRFFGNTPIVANLMWRPLLPDAPQPTWEPSKLLDGLDFCPAYPWMHGRRLYWGRRFSYTGVLVKEGLRRPGILGQLPILGSHRGDNWTIVKVGVPEADLSRAVKLIQSTLIEEPTYFAHLYREDEVIIIFPDRIFTTRKGSRELREAYQYGLEKGIPSNELDFAPFDPESDS